MLGDPRQPNRHRNVIGSRGGARAMARMRANKYQECMDIWREPHAMGWRYVVVRTEDAHTMSYGYTFMETVWPARAAAV